jgi:hypothetical protein
MRAKVSGTPMNADITPMNAEEIMAIGSGETVGNVVVPCLASFLPLSAFIGVISAFIGVPETFARITPYSKRFAARRAS